MPMPEGLRRSPSGWAYRRALAMVVVGSVTFSVHLCAGQEARTSEPSADDSGAAEMPRYWVAAAFGMLGETEQQYDDVFMDYSPEYSMDGALGVEGGLRFHSGPFVFYSEGAALPIGSVYMLRADVVLGPECIADYINVPIDTFPVREGRVKTVNGLQLGIEELFAK